MGKTRANYNWKNTGFPVVYDKTTVESIVPMFPVVFYDDFLGGDIVLPATGTVESGCPWSTLIVAGGAAAKVAGAINGIVQLALDATDEAQIAVLDWNDQVSLSLAQGLIFEARVRMSVLPTTGTEDSQAVFGLASAHNATLDTVATNAWFRIESAANTVLLWEVDDNTANNDDDNTCAGVTLAAGDYHIYRIDATNVAAVKFYVDGVLKGTGNMDGFTGVTDKVQPYFNVSKTHATTSTGLGTMLIDYVKIFQDRS